ncbi:MAG TPA: hypothetical protein V6C90_18370 [Coleofasciculaceae cyanobacterium]
MLTEIDTLGQRATLRTVRCLRRGFTLIAHLLKIQSDRVLIRTFQTPFGIKYPDKERM